MNYDYYLKQLLELEFQRMNLSMESIAAEGFMDYDRVESISEEIEDIQRLSSYVSDKLKELGG